MVDERRIGAGVLVEVQRHTVRRQNSRPSTNDNAENHRDQRGPSERPHSPSPGRQREIEAVDREQQGDDGEGGLQSDGRDQDESSAQRTQNRTEGVRGVQVPGAAPDAGDIGRIGSQSDRKGGTQQRRRNDEH